MDFESLKKSLTSKGTCPICQVHYDGLRNHFNACARKRGAASLLANAAQPSDTVGGSKETRYKCEFCKATYASLKSKFYQNHLKNVHKKVVDVNDKSTNESTFMHLTNLHLVPLLMEMITVTLHG